MAAAFPGVQAYQDNEADISVRGNSQSGVLYRLEGLDIPVISHFNRPISSGGAISILSIQVLNDSDFSTGAFAAEYGNASSAVFDMHFRKGNKNNREYTAKLGLFGLDFATEGPFKKGNSSYLLNYRYSTLGILSNLGFFVVRDNVSNTFQDLSLNLTFDSDNSKNQFNIFGIGALSNEQWFVRDSAKWVSNLDFQRIDNRCGTAALGFNYIRLLDEKSYLKVLLGGTASSIILNKNNAYLDSARIETNEYLRLDYTLSGTYSRKFNNWFRIKTGLSARANMSDLSYENYNFETNSLDTLIHTNGFAWMLWGQGYLQTNFSISKMLSINAGLHAMYFGLNKTASLEPRFSLQAQLARKTRLSLAYGLHGQILPIGTLLIQTKDSSGQYIQPNIDLPIAKAHHAVLSFRQLLGNDMTIQVEGWFQQLFNLPVGVGTANSFFLYNQRDSYGFGALSSEGSGRNFGVDLMFERYFRKGFYVLISGSVFRSNYEINSQSYRTRFDNFFASCLSVGQEFDLKKGNNISLGLRLVANGGFRYEPLNDTLSATVGLPLSQSNSGYSLGQSDESGSFLNKFYHRADVRIAYRKDWKKLSLLISFDAQNIYNNTNNLFQINYDVSSHSIIRRPNSGLLPVLSIQLDF